MDLGSFEKKLKDAELCNENIKKTNARLLRILNDQGICATCGDIYEHSILEPTVCCKCGVFPWGKKTLSPHMELVKELSFWKNKKMGPITNHKKDK